jgi:oligopeptide/dipeptide ABC transporter ATP-binding protein
MSSPLLEVRELSVSYRSAGRVIRALTGVSLSLARGQTLGIVGESGCGKSTLGRALLRLVDADSGQVLFDDTDITRHSRAAMRPLRTRMQMVFQDPFGSLNPRRSAADLIAEPLRIHGRGDATAQAARVAELLAQVGLQPQHGTRLPHEFSGGQRQRIGIARALALEPELLVCDEPVSALDVSVRAQILNLLVDTQRRYGLAMLFISHDLSVIRYVSDEVAVLYLGRVVERGPADALFDSPRHPYTRALIASVPSTERPGEAFGDRELAAGDVPDPASPPSGCAYRTRCPQAGERCAEQVPELRPLARQQVACHFAE